MRSGASSIGVAVTDRPEPADPLPADAVARLVGGDLDRHDGLGTPLSRRSRQGQRKIESYLKAGNAPRWMERVSQVDRGIARERRRVERAYRDLRRRLGADPERFAAAWAEQAGAFRFDEALNTLIRQHNEWYPIERDLPIDLRTRDYVKVHGRTHRRPVLGADWVLAEFPARAGAA